MLDTPEEERFDRITRLIVRLLDVSMSTVTLIDGHRQWFKSRQGISGRETPRGPALCAFALEEPHALIVPDTLADERFANNPLVLGPPFIRAYAGVPLRAPGGEAIGTLCAMDTTRRVFSQKAIDTLYDLAQIVRSELELRLLATTDSLTGALSRRAFHVEADRALALARRHKHTLSCLMLDLDHFKAVNDRYGHAVGDIVLAETVARCQGLARRSDLIGRTGGVEFAIVLPHTNATAAMAAAEKMRAAIGAQPMQTGQGGVTISASFGVATAEVAVENIDALLQHADAALYDAKAAGRDRCAAWRAPASAAQRSAVSA